MRALTAGATPIFAIVWLFLFGCSKGNDSGLLDITLHADPRGYVQPVTSLVFEGKDNLRRTYWGRLHVDPVRIQLPNLPAGDWYMLVSAMADGCKVGSKTFLVSILAGKKAVLQNISVDRADVVCSDSGIGSNARDGHDAPTDDRDGSSSPMFDAWTQKDSPYIFESDSLGLDMKNSSDLGVGGAMASGGVTASGGVFSLGGSSAIDSNPLSGGASSLTGGEITRSGGLGIEGGAVSLGGAGGWDGVDGPAFGGLDANGGIVNTGGSAVVGGTLNTGGTLTGGAPGTGGAQALGTACNAGNQCASGVCADDVCCDKLCGGCNACTSTLNGKQTGICSAAIAGSNPHGACSLENPPCGHDGTCDGAGACRFGAGGTPCGTNCSNAVLSQSGCDGAGNCKSGIGVACPGLLVCADATRCKATCAGHSDCTTNYCMSGECAPEPSSGDALYATTVPAQFISAVTTDASGNVFVAGVVNPGTYTIGGESIVGPGTLLIKYSSTGSLLWVRSSNTGSSTPQFKGVATDSLGNVFVAGGIYGDNTTTFGSQSVKGSSAGWNLLVVKYDSSGNALWAQSNSSGGVSESSNTVFHGIAVDASGSAYVVGEIWGTGTYTFGAHSVQGVSSVAGATVIVKYNTLGIAAWARGVSASQTSGSSFRSVAVDAIGNVYAVGLIYLETYLFGTHSVSGNGVSSAGVSPVIVKYSSNGGALWAKTSAASTKDMLFNGVATDVNNDIIAAGYMGGNISHTFGQQTVTGPSPDRNFVLLKFTPNGDAIWARTASGTGSSRLHGVATDNSGNSYAIGDFEQPGISVGGDSLVGVVGVTNLFIAKYDTLGNAIWGRTVTSGPGASAYYSTAVDRMGNAYALGQLRTDGTYLLGSQSAVGKASLLVQYKQ